MVFADDTQVSPSEGGPTVHSLSPEPPGSDGGDLLAVPMPGWCPETDVGSDDSEVSSRVTGLRPCRILGGLCRTTANRLHELFQYTVLSPAVGRGGAGPGYEAALLASDLPAAMEALERAMFNNNDSQSLIHTQLAMADLVGAGLARLLVLQQGQDDAALELAERLLEASNSLAQATSMLCVTAEEAKRCGPLLRSDKRFNLTGLGEGQGLVSLMEAAIVRATTKGEEGEAGVVAECFRGAMEELVGLAKRDRFASVVRWRACILLSLLQGKADRRRHQDFVLGVCECLAGPVLGKGGADVLSESAVEQQAVLLAMAVALHLTEGEGREEEEDVEGRACDSGEMGHQRARHLLHGLQHLVDAARLPRQDPDVMLLRAIALAARAEMAVAELQLKSYRGVKDLPSCVRTLIDGTLKRRCFLDSEYLPKRLDQLGPHDGVLLPLKLLRLAEALVAHKHPHDSLWTLLAALQFLHRMHWSDAVPRLCTRAMWTLRRLEALPLEDMGLHQSHRNSIRWAAYRGEEGARQLQRDSTAQLAHVANCIRMQARAFLVVSVPATRPFARVRYENRMKVARRHEEELQARLEREARRRAERAVEASSKGAGSSSSNRERKLARDRRRTAYKARAGRAKDEIDHKAGQGDTPASSDDEEEEQTHKEERRVKVPAEEETEGEMCCVCRVADEHVSHSGFTCGHVFHQHCLSQWEEKAVASSQDQMEVIYNTAMAYTCPLCRCDERA